MSLGTNTAVNENALFAAARIAAANRPVNTGHYVIAGLEQDADVAGAIWELPNYDPSHLPELRALVLAISDTELVLDTTVLNETHELHTAMLSAYRAAETPCQPTVILPEHIYAALLEPGTIAAVAIAFLRDQAVRVV
ncbi:hypothetical protein HJC99_06765 [Candidatus Saccharibacteria bacterium]|nr:hypothetical protein [Candidatus Saccharibacteria bacterium]